MIGLAEAQARLLASIGVLDVEHIPVAQAVGRYAAADVLAKRTQPAADLSAMDGYALAGDGPWQVIGESAAGRAYREPITAGQAVRIFTGAVVPQGADRVVMQEEALLTGEELRLGGDHPKSGQHIRHAGGDFATGDVLIKKGDLLTAARIALAIMGGHATLPVHQRPRIALLSTGDELVKPGMATGLDQIPNSNGPMLAALLATESCLVVELPVVRDDLKALEQAIKAAQYDIQCDILVTIGGASVGDHDLVRPALLGAGATLDYWKVAMRPGKPVMAGHLGDMIVLGLPGNPVSAYVTALLFLVPALRAMAGANDPFLAKSLRRLGEPLAANGPRVDHIRAIETEDGVKPVGVNDSAALVSLAKATVLIIREPAAEAAEIGETVAIYHLA